MKRALPLILWLSQVGAWAWRERAWLKPMLLKYLDHFDNAAFDGEATKQALLKYEPYLWRYIQSGGSVFAAIFGGARTREQEEELFRRASGNGEF